jgi:hypothetical protein
MLELVNLNPSEMDDIVRELFVPRLAADMGVAGTAVLKRLLNMIRQVHLAISTERIAQGLTIISGVATDQPCRSGPYASFSDALPLTSYFDGTTSLTVQMTAGGLLVWADELETNPDYDFIGYRYTMPHAEEIFTRQKVYEVPKVAASPSYFGIPYFLDLKKSLEQYGETWVKESQCEIFAAAWLDSHRILFGPRPEFRMRRSLQRYLRSGLREQTGVAIMPEQNINETRPVDIKVTWSSNRVALIEIKWLGKSARPGEPRATQQHGERRAREGAAQLADYLNLYHKELPHEEARGYLAVFDARRRGVVLPIDDVSRVNGSYYKYREIEYGQEILSRPDFEYPCRFFCEIAP